MKTVKIYDATLERAVSVGKKLSFKDKLDAVKLFEELKVDAVRLGRIGDNKENLVFARTLAETVKSTVLCCSVGFDRAEVDRVNEIFKGKGNKRLVVDIPSSPALMEYKLGKKPQVALSLLADILSYAKETGAEAEIRLLDASNAETAFLKQVVSLSSEHGVKEITLCEEASQMLPEEFSAFLAEIISAAKDNGVTVNVSVKNSLGLSLALSLAAVSAGAAAIETAFGDELLVSSDAFITLVSSVGNRQGIAVNALTTAVNRIANSIREVLGEKGERKTLKVALIDDKMLPADISKEELFAIISKLGYDLSGEDLLKVYETFRRITAKKGNVKVRELDALIADSAMQVPAEYKIVDYIINSGNIIRATASVTLERNGEKLFGLSTGDGPIDAAFHAIESITGSRYEVDDFKIESLTEGKDAVGRAILRLRSSGVVFVGAGISTDIVGSAIRAYVAALNKIAFTEAQGDK